MVVLAYHRVVAPLSDPQLLSVSPEHFAEQMEHLRENYSLIDVNSLARCLQQGQLPKRAVAVTFDDGYADNLSNAKPILKRFEIPAAVFVTTGYVGQEREFWWDELERLLLGETSLPERLVLTLNGEKREWQLGEAATFSTDTEQAHRLWHVELRENPTSRHYVYRDLHKLLRPIGHRDRDLVFEELRSQARSDGRARPDYQALAPDDVICLAKDNLVTIGAHTVTHPVLASVPPDVQKDEIAMSKKNLEYLLGQPVTSFAYPYGGWSDVGNTAVRNVREAGYQVAFANIPGAVSRSANRYWLPRFLVRDWDGDEFGKRLATFFSG